MSFLSDYLEKRAAQNTEDDQYEFEAQSPEELLESITANTAFTSDLVGTGNKDARKQNRAVLDSLGSIGESLISSEFSEELLIDAVENSSESSDLLAKQGNTTLLEIAQALSDIATNAAKLEKYLRPELNPKDDTYGKARKAAFDPFPALKEQKSDTEKDTSVSDFLGSLLGEEKKPQPKTAGKSGKTYRPVPVKTGSTGKKPKYKPVAKPSTQPPAGRFSRLWSSTKSAMGNATSKASTAAKDLIGKAKAKIASIKPQPRAALPAEVPKLETAAPKQTAPKAVVPKVSVAAPNVSVAAPNVSVGSPGTPAVNVSSPTVNMTSRLRDAWRVVHAKSKDTFKAATNTISNSNTSKIIVDRAREVPSAVGRVASRVSESAKPVASRIYAGAKKAIGSVQTAYKPSAAGVGATTGATTGASAAAPTLLGRAGTLLSKAATPLAVGLSGYEAYTTEQRDDLSREEKNVKHGGTAGGLAGALAGAKVGGVVGGTAGAAAMGIGALPGAIIGALGGGLAGYFGGSALGEKAVTAYQKATTSITELPDEIKHHVGETAVKLGEAADAQQATTDVQKSNVETAQAAVISSTSALNSSATSFSDSQHTLTTSNDGAAKVIADGATASAAMLASGSVEASGLLKSAAENLSKKLAGVFGEAETWLKDSASSLLSSSARTINRISIKAGEWLSTTPALDKAKGTALEKPAEALSKAAKSLGAKTESAGTGVAQKLAKASSEIKPARTTEAITPTGKGAVNEKTQANWNKYGADIVEAADRYGVAPDVMAKLMRVESGNFDAAVDTQRQNWLAGKQGASSAAGLGQFVDATWADQLRRYGSENAETAKYVESARTWLSDKRSTKEKHQDPMYSEMIEAKLNPKANALMSAAYTKENMGRLEKAGVNNPTATEQYSVHMTGNAKAARAFRENPGAAIESVFTPAEIKNNPGYFRESKTVGDVFSSMQRKLDAGQAYGDAALAMSKNLKPSKNQKPISEVTQLAADSGKDPKVTTLPIAESRLDKIAQSAVVSDQPKAAQTPKVSVHQAGVTKATGSSPTTTSLGQDSQPIRAEGKASVDYTLAAHGAKSPKIAPVDSLSVRSLPKSDKFAYSGGSDSGGSDSPVPEVSVTHQVLSQTSPNTAPSSGAVILSSKQTPIPRISESLPQEPSPVSVVNPVATSANQSAAPSHSVGNAFDTALPKLDNVPLQVTDLGLVLLNVGHI